LVEVAMPHLVRLRDRTGWSAHLGELHGREVVYLARVPTRRTVASTVNVGTRLPARSTAMGRVLLARLRDDTIRDLYRDEPSAPAKLKTAASLSELVELIADDRANGFVVQNAVYEPGVASVAAPIHDMTDSIVAAVNISAISLFTNDAELNGPIKTEVLAAADAISRDLGRKPGISASSPQSA
jgi:DNA-binding IclR family transcriptional regulator